MPIYSLLPHPDHPPPAGLVLSVEATREAGALKLLYILAGDSEDRLVAVGSPGSGGRTDGLWEHTCFEAFVMVEGTGRYRELNFSPWGEWAAYDFSDRRAGRRDLRLGDEPLAWLNYKGEIGDDGDYAWLFWTNADFDGGEEWRVGLSAVIEQSDGTKSYWALAHAPGPPDFHNPACFTAHLPPPPRA